MPPTPPPDPSPGLLAAIKRFIIARVERSWRGERPPRITFWMVIWRALRPFLRGV